MENEIQLGLDGDFQLELDKLEACGNLRVLPETCSDGKWIEAGGRRMLNLSSNDYLGLASDKALREEFLQTVKERDLCFSSSSSRLLLPTHTDEHCSGPILPGLSGAWMRRGADHEFA